MFTLLEMLHTHAEININRQTHSQQTVECHKCQKRQKCQFRKPKQMSENEKACYTQDMGNASCEQTLLLCVYIIIHQYRCECPNTLVRTYGKHQKF